MFKRDRRFKGRIASALCALVFVAVSVQLTGITVGAEDTSSVYAELYVSPDGDDSASGTIDEPLKTLEGARDAVRNIKDGMTGDILVNFREGVYRMTEAVDFDTRDSAPDGMRIIYKAYENETPVFSGAKQVTGWEKYNDKLWCAPLDRDIKLRSLYVNDRRANMGSVTAEAKGGYGEYRVTAGQADWAWVSDTKSDGVKYNAGDIPKIETNKDDLEIVNGTTWNENVVCTRDVRYENDSVVFLPTVSITTTALRG